MKKLILFILPLLTLSVYAQDKGLKEQAIEAFKKEHYNKSIRLLNEALKESGDDAEVFYYLGMSYHDRAYDGRPFAEYDSTYSNRIFKYLDKAIEFKPDYGDAKYLYGIECSVNALNAMQNNDLNRLKYFYEKASDKGAYPEWLTEFGRNILNSCDKNGILFTGEDVDYEICMYLQLHENYRTDVSVIPLNNIDRPWYVKFLRDGLEGAFKPVNIKLTDEQIFDMRPYKWRTKTISINYDRIYQRELGLAGDHKLEWVIEPDLILDRTHDDIENEIALKRRYLSPQRAILLQIIQDNYNNRKIFFSNLCNPFFMAGLDRYTRNRGLVGELFPIRTIGTTIENDYEQMAMLLSEDNLKDYQSLKESDMPRISGILYQYHNNLISLARYYKVVKDEGRFKNLLKIYSESLRGVNKNDDQYYTSLLNKI